jgi:hypothetical protein
LGGDVTEKDLVVHDEKGPAAYAFMLAQMEAPAFPVPIGVIRNVAAPVLEVAMHEQIAQVHGQERARRSQRLALQRRHLEVR